MKKIAVIFTALLLAGCIKQAPVNTEYLNSIKTYHIGPSSIMEVCVDGVVYLVYDDGYNSGNITPKINADFYPYTCNNPQTHNNP